MKHLKTETEKSDKSTLARERGARLKFELKKMKLKQREVAAELEMSLSGLTYLLSGRSLIRPGMAYAFEHRYSIPSDYILHGIAHPPLAAPQSAEDWKNPNGRMMMVWRRSGKTQKQFAKSLGVSMSCLCSLLGTATRVSSVSRSVAVHVEALYEVNHEWILDGTMPYHSPRAAELEELRGRLNEYEAELRYVERQLTKTIEDAQR